VRALHPFPTRRSSDLPADAALRTRVEGEAHFLRAYAHFELFRFYAGNYDPNGLAMPYMETPSLEPHACDNMGDYFTKLLSDITRSEEHTSELQSRENL